MGTESLLTVLTCLVGLAVTILIAGIPWAYSVHGRLTKMESNSETSAKLLELVFSMERRVTTIEAELKARGQ